MALLIGAAVAAGTAGARAALWLLAMAAPLVAVAAVVLGQFPSLLVVLGSAIASGPLWVTAGRVLAERTVRRTAPGDAVRWGSFWKLYAVTTVAWMTVATAAIAALAR